MGPWFRKSRGPWELLTHPATLHHITPHPTTAHLSTPHHNIPHHSTPQHPMNEVLREDAMKEAAAMREAAAKEAAQMRQKANEEAATCVTVSTYVRVSTCVTVSVYYYSMMPGIAGIVLYVGCTGGIRPIMRGNHTNLIAS